MNKKIKLKKFFDSKKEPSEYIEKYEENLNFFNELIERGRKEDIEYVLPIKLYNYASPLNETGKHKKALIIAKELENDLEKIKGRSEWYKMYLEGVTFQKGVSLSNLKRYQQSNVEFRKLILYNPKNDTFIKWYKANKKNQANKVAGIAGILGLVYFFLLKTSMDMGIESKNIIVRDFGLFVAICAYPGLLIWRKIIDKTKIKLRE